MPNPPTDRILPCDLADHREPDDVEHRAMPQRAARRRGVGPRGEPRSGLGGVHTYERPEDADIPSLSDWRFNSPSDVVAWAERDPVIGWSTWPEVWHLDDDGELHCYFKGSSFDTLESWASDPYPLRRSRREGLATGYCPNRWLIVDSRPTWMESRPAPTEADAAAFAVVERELASLGVHLVDVMVFDDQGHWWSLRELTTGSTSWWAKQ